MANNEAETAWKEYCNRNWKKGPVDAKTAFMAGYKAGQKAAVALNPPGAEGEEGRK